jgi:hypothetical protein
MKNKKVYALYLGMKSIRRMGEPKPENGFNSGIAEMGVVEINENGQIRNVGVDSMLDSLTFYCQWNEKIGSEPFAFEVYVDAPRADLQRAELALKVLKKARRVEKAFPVHPTTFGQWAVLMARGLGITKLVKLVGGSGMSFDDNDHRTFSLTEAQHIIDSAITDVRPKEVAA